MTKKIKPPIKIPGDYLLFDCISQQPVKFFDTEAQALGYYGDMLRVLGQRVAGNLVVNKRRGFSYRILLDQRAALDKAVAYV